MFLRLLNDATSTVEQIHGVVDALDPAWDGLHSLMRSAIKIAIDKDRYKTIRPW